MNVLLDLGQDREPRGWGLPLRRVRDVHFKMESGQSGPPSLTEEPGGWHVGFGPSQKAAVLAFSKYLQGISFYTLRPSASLRYSALLPQRSDSFETLNRSTSCSLLKTETALRLKLPPFLPSAPLSVPEWHRPQGQFRTSSCRFSS